ncbi:hypothetical protein BBJ28_00014713 [Nothophytophthora sp. Chile5]|nr:hypothetical protein BBJ28_00014713 [Nothophytophthora sp. Chile5]
MADVLAVASACLTYCNRQAKPTRSVTEIMQSRRRPGSTSRLKQHEGRVAALSSVASRSIEGGGEDVAESGKASSYRAMADAAARTDELEAILGRKTQQLCDDTRAQCEQRLRRQEAQHERQLQSLQRRLQQVLGSCVSLNEHEQILAAVAAKQQLEREEICRRHGSEMHELERRCAQEWQAKVHTLEARVTQDNAVLWQQIEQLELRKSEAAVEAKQLELAELQLREQLAEAVCVKGGVEKRLQDAGHLVASLRMRLRRQKQVTRDLAAQRAMANEVREELMACKLSHAEIKGRRETQVAAMEKEMTHLERALKDEKACTSAQQTQIGELRDQVQRQQCSAVELAAKEALRAEHSAVERAKLQKEVETLRNALKHQTRHEKDTSRQMEEKLHQATVAQLHDQELRTRLELQAQADASRHRQMQRQMQQMRQRMAQLKLLAEKLRAENDELHNRDASTEAWAKTLFGRN